MGRPARYPIIEIASSGRHRKSSRTENLPARRIHPSLAVQIPVIIYDSLDSPSHLIGLESQFFPNVQSSDFHLVAGCSAVGKTLHMDTFTWYYVILGLRN